jgi:hypothetical protein
MAHISDIDVDDQDWDFRENPEDRVNQTGEKRKNMTTEKRKLGRTDCLTPEFRMSYPTLLEPRAPDPAQPARKNYGVEMLFRVAETPQSKKLGEKVVTLEALKTAALEAVKGKWGQEQSRWPTDLREKLAKLFKRGEVGKNADKDGYGAGVIYVRASRREEFGAPLVVDQLVAPVTDKNLIYGGAYARAKIHAYAWTHPTGGNGVSFTLDLIQLVRDGEPFGNRLNAADAFEAIAVPGEARKEAAPTQAEAKDLFAGLG